MIVCNVDPFVAFTVPKMGAVIDPQELAMHVGAADHVPLVVQVRIADAEIV